MKLTTFISAKKVLFVLAIVRNNTGALSKILKLRLEEFVNDRAKCQSNRYRSPLFDIFTECARFDVLRTLQDMVNGCTPLISKSKWSMLVWQRAWIIEDAFWNGTNLIMKENDLLVGTMSNANYLTWWQLSDIHPEHMRACEIMARLVCHASRLKGDDCRLKSLPYSHRTCANCDLYLVEDVRHILLQCPANTNIMTGLFDELALKCPNVSNALNDNPSMSLLWLLGKPIQHINDDEMTMARIIIASIVSDLYYSVVSRRTGIG